jgi:hypothetical protein
MTNMTILICLLTMEFVCYGGIEKNNKIIVYISLFS